MSHPRTVAKLVTLLVLVLLAAPMSAAGAVVGSSPDAGVETNAVVRTIASSADRVFLGGSFTRAGKPTGPGADLGQSDGLRNPAFARVNGTINAVAPDGAGGWYVGGAFTRAGALARNNLAHLLADGSVDAAFDPNVDDSVLALARSGGTLYAGGSFRVVNGLSVAGGGTARNRLAAFDTASGHVVASFDPNASSTVFALVLSGGTLYAGGEFATVNATKARNRLAAFDTATATATSFNPNVAGTVSSLALSGGTLFAGGAFTTVNGATTRNRVAAFATASGSATSFDPNITTADSSVSALVVSGGTVYAGGNFTRVNGTVLDRARIAAFDATSGTATSFNPEIRTLSSTVSALALSGSTLFAGGTFTDVKGNTAVRNRLAAFDTGDGSVVAGFDPNLDGAVNALAVAGTRIYAGGTFDFANADTIRNGLAAMKPDGTLDATFVPTDTSGGSGGAVYALALSGSTLYVGGSFSTRLIALDATTGARLPGFTTGVGLSTVSALALLGGKVYAGGDFTRVNVSITRNRLAAFDATTGALDPFNPNINGPVLALAVVGGKLYAGGDFTVVNATTTRRRLVAFDPASAIADPGFNPDANGAVGALATSGASLFAGGDFTTINGSVTRNHLAALSPVTGAVDGAFAPSLNDSVAALALSGSTLYAGGAFTFVGTSPETARSGLAAFDTAGDGTVLSTFDPNMGGQVNALLASGTHLYAGGGFTSVGGSPVLRFAGFSGQAAAPAAVSGAASAITTGTASLAGSVDPHGAATAYVFEYGPSLSFGSITTPESAGSGEGAVAVSGSLAGLTAHTTYYYRLVATSSVGTAFGVVRSFITGGTAVAPVVVTQDASSPDGSSAVLAGLVNPNGQQTACTFEWGTSTSFGAITPVAALDSAISDEPVSATLTGLSPGTTYFYRLVATNATGTSTGVVHSFTTGPITTAGAT